MNFLSMRKIVDLVAKAENEFAILTELFRGGIFVDAINCRDRPLPQLARDRFIGREHEFFNQLMRFVVLNPLEPNRLAVLIDINFDFRKIKIERAVLEAFLTEQ